MNKNLTILIVGLFSIAMILGVALYPFVVTGYDGITVRVNRVDSPADTILTIGTQTVQSSWVEQYNTSSAVVYPDTPDILDAFMSCGTHLTVQAVPGDAGYQTLEMVTNETLATIVEANPNDALKTNETITWVVQEVTMRFGLTVETYRGGLLQTPMTTYWLKLSQNDYSVFNDADRSKVFFMQVYSYEPGEKVGVIEVDGEDQGFVFDMNSLGAGDIPQWILNSEYSGKYDLDTLQYLTDVEIPIVVREAAPTTIAGAIRQESKIDLHIEVRLLLFGQWVRTAPYVPWESADNPDPWQWLWDILGGIATLIMLGVGILLTIVVVIKVPNPYAKVLTVILIWVILAVPLGWYGLFLGGG